MTVFTCASICIIILSSITTSPITITTTATAATFTFLNHLCAQLTHEYIENKYKIHEGRRAVDGHVQNEVIANFGGLDHPVIGSIV